jgi:hypothetical protein
MESVVQNLETIMTDHSEKILKDIEKWKQQYTGQIRNIIAQQSQSPQMFTDRYSEDITNKNCIDLKAILHDVIKNRLRSDEWIIFHCIYYTSDSGRGIGYDTNSAEYVVTNYSSLYSLRSWCDKDGKMKIVNLIGNTKLSNDNIDYMKQMYMLIVSLIGKSCDHVMIGNDERRVYNNLEYLNMTFPFVDRNDKTRRLDTNDHAVCELCSSCNSDYIKNVNVFLIKKNIRDCYVIDEVDLNERKDIRMSIIDDICTPIPLIHSVMMEINNKYWNRNCIGQEALKIKRDNEELKKQYDNFKLERQKLDQELEKFRVEKDEFDKLKREFSDTNGITKILEKEGKLKEEREKFESTSGLEFIKNEKERLKKVKEQLCNMKIVIDRERIKLDEDVNKFKKESEKSLQNINSIDV